MTPLWQATKERKENSHIFDFMRWLSARGQSFSGYSDLHHWSITDTRGFWHAVWDYFDIQFDGKIDQIQTETPMPDTRWFTGTSVNYAEHVLRNETNGDPNRSMIEECSELRDLRSLSWSEIAGKVRRLATTLRGLGVQPGDRVVAYMPNIAETVIAMLASTAIGAVWSSAAPEFGSKTVIDRFSQIEPKVVFATNGYRFGGKDFDRIDDLETILDALPTATHLIMLDYHPTARKIPRFTGETLTWNYMLSGPEIDRQNFKFERVPSDHPLWVLFSSGTTGLPKAIVHGHHGIILEHYKSAAFHFEIPKDGALFFYSTTGWMVWNTLMWGPMMNGRAVLYDGHPAHPDARLIWKIANDTRATTLGISPTYLQMVRNQGIVPKDEFQLTALQSVLLVGSPATPEVFEWVKTSVKSDVWASSQSGGTEFCSGILAGSIDLPTYAGEIQAPGLGTDAVAFDDDGQVIIDAAGELVVRQPMPSMPLFFWNDAEKSRYHESYFETYPHVWHHGDRAMFNARGGSFVLGRSDATLNRFGVRIGSAEIYRTLEGFSEIADSLIVCVEQTDGGYYMPLFVEMTKDVDLTPPLKTEIIKRLRSERSPRHVPDEIIATPSIPMTLTGKKMEIPVRKLIMGQDASQVASKDAMRNPAALDWFATFAKEHRGRG
jgi:acetoacetyl-CoA synthetase